MQKMIMAVVLLSMSLPAMSDEGMWTLDNFPAATVKQKYGAEISDEWLDTVKKSVARLENGCSASFVSPSGLVLTNHHCAVECVAQNSSAENDLEANGFLAADKSSELACPTFSLSVLEDTEEITDNVAKATAGMDDKEAGEARRQALKRHVQECEEQSGQKCESVALYQGGQHWLYKYKRYDDVRLAFAPESDIAGFGGDPDNFNFPRWCLDMTVLRIYEDGKPARTPNYLQWRKKGLEQGEAMFVAGRPGNTQRLLTVSDLKFLRDTAIPHWLMRYVELRGRLIQYASTSDEANRTAQTLLQQYENFIKVQRKRLDALHSDELFAQKAAAELELKAAVAADPVLAAKVGSAWSEIANANETYLEFRDDYYFLEVGAAFLGEQFKYARSIVRAAAEREKPNVERLAGYTEAELPRLKQVTLADKPIYPELEILMLSFSLDKMREFLGPDSPFVTQILGQDSPAALATSLVSGTRLADAKARTEYWEADLATLRESDDPMIALALAVDDSARALRKRYEDEVEAPSDLAYERIAAAQFAIHGTDTYPDATFTLRVTYGAHEGWKEKGSDVRPWTTAAELYPRVTGESPFKLPASWNHAKDSMMDNTKFNFVGTTDIIGGNSGSPVLDADGKLAGLIFDGNIHSISGAYWFDSERNRSVAVHPEVMIESLRRIYRADHLLEEMQID